MNLTTRGGSTFSFGWLVALLVVIVCVVLAIVGKPTPLLLLGLIGALAVAFLLG